MSHINPHCSISFALGQYHIPTGVTRLLLRAADLVRDEVLSDEERRLRERLRLTSKGILSYQLRPGKENHILVPYQQHIVRREIKERMSQHHQIAWTTRFTIFHLVIHSFLLSSCLVPRRCDFSDSLVFEFHRSDDFEFDAQLEDDKPRCAELCHVCT